MHLDDFADVHPKWEIIENLNEEESHAVLDLLLLATYLDKEFSAQKVEMLTEEWDHLPFVGPPDSADELVDRMLDSHSTIKRISENPKLLKDYLEDIAERIPDEDARFAVFRLVAMVVMSDGPTEAEFALCYGVGYEFGFQLDTVEDILRSIWETHEAVSDRDKGFEHHIPPIQGRRWSRRRSQRPYPNPFSQRIGS